MPILYSDEASLKPLKLLPVFEESKKKKEKKDDAPAEGESEDPLLKGHTVSFPICVTCCLILVVQALRSVKRRSHKDMPRQASHEFCWAFCSSRVCL